MCSILFSANCSSFFLSFEEIKFKPLPCPTTDTMKKELCGGLKRYLLRDEGNTRPLGDRGVSIFGVECCEKPETEKKVKVRSGDAIR